MSTDLMINVTYNGDEAFKDNFFKIPYDITWLDLEALFKAHFDCDRLSVTYLDQENDEVSIGSQDELFEAFRYAMKNKDVLYVKVIPLDQGASIFRMDDSLDAQQQQINEERKDRMPPQQGVEDEPFPSPGPDVAIPLPDVDNESLRVHKSDMENEDQDDKVADGDEKEMVHTIEFHTLLNQRQTSQDSINDQLSYQEFVTFMTQLKHELRTEIVRDVTKKTVKQVLKGLDGAVIESLQSSQATVGASMSGSARPMPSDSHPVYSHNGVVCDACNNVIIGPRYKCGNCLDFDLCEQCEAKPGMHDSEHVFVKIRIPCTKLGVSSHGHRYPLLKSCIYTGQKTYRTKMVVPIAKEQELENELNFKLEGKMKDIFARNIVKRKTERMMAKLKKKEEKLKRRMDQMSESPLKRERLDLLDDDSTVRYDFYKVLMGAQFICDISVPDSTKLQSGTKFTKTWRMKNDGDGPWSESTKLKLMWGNIPTPEIEVNVPHLKPGEEGNMSVDFVSPAEPGHYQSHWKLYEHGMQFGSRIWCTIIVVPRETLEPTEPATDSLKVVMDASQRSETGELQEVKVEEKKGESIKITFRPSEEEHLREVAVRREPDVQSLLSDKHDSVFVNVENIDEKDESLEIDYRENSGKQEAIEDAGKHEELKDSGRQEIEKDDGKQETVKVAGKQEEAEDAGKCDIERQFEHVDVEGEVRDDRSDSCEGFVVYAKHGDTNDVVEVVKQEDQKDKEADQKLEADLTSAVARLTLEGDKREQIPLVSQTATPNNTPFDVTPLKTPNPEPEDDIIEEEEEDVEKDLKRISNSSSVELVLPPENEEFQDEHVENYIKTRLASIELKPDIDLESVSSYSDDDESDMSDSDYFIVPMPDCFNITKPLNQSTTLSSYSNSVVDRDFSLDDNHNSISQRSSRAVSVDEILTTSGVIEQRPLSPTQPESQRQPETVKFREGVENRDMTESTDSFHEPETVPPEVNEIEVPTVHIVTEQPCGVSSLPLPVGGEDAVSSPSMDEHPGGADGDGASGAASGENVDSQTQSGEVATDNSESKESISASAQMPDNVNFVKVNGQKGKQPKSVDFAPEFANQLVATAVNAAGQAYITAKAVFKTWQDKQSEKEATRTKSKPILKAWKPASTQYVPPKEEEQTAPKLQWVPADQEEFTPPKSDWKPQEPAWKPKDSDFKPPESNYKPPESNYKPPESSFTPPKSNWKPPTQPPKVAKEQKTPPPKESGPMGKLFDMGFMDRELNSTLLSRHNGDVQLVIQDLLSLALP